MSRNIPKLHLFILLFFILTLANCATSSAGIATSNVPIINRKYRVIGPAQKQTAWFTFDIAIIGIQLGKPPIDKLVDVLIQENNADALINIKYWQDRSVFLFLTRNRIGISADAIKFEEDSKINLQPLKK